MVAKHTVIRGMKGYPNWFLRPVDSTPTAYTNDFVLPTFRFFVGNHFSWKQDGEVNELIKECNWCVTVFI